MNKAEKLPVESVCDCWVAHRLCDFGEVTFRSHPICELRIRSTLKGSEQRITYIMLEITVIKVLILQR